MITSRADNRQDQALQGAYIELDNLIRARFGANDLKLHHRRKALSLLAGPNKTNFRGRGIDFEEVRAYQAGDDIRAIDWRVTARSGKPYTKLFQEERERPMLVVTDQRQPMFFGSQHCFKSVLACYLGALIAWSGIQNNDRVGGLVLGNYGQREVRPKRSRKSVLALMNLMLEYNQLLSRNSDFTENGAPQSEQQQAPSPAQRLEASLIELRRIAKPGSAIYLISDFTGFACSEDPQASDNAIKHLHQLSRHCEITSLFVYDRLEQTLPPPGQYTVSDGNQRSQIDTGNSAARQRYEDHFEQRLAQLHHQLAKLGIPLIEVGTHEAPLQRLLHYYGARR